MKASRDGYQPKCKECSAKYDYENRERIAERKRKYYELNKQRIIDGQADYRAASKDKISIRMRDYYSNKKGEYYLRYLKRRAEKPESIAANARAARARKKNAPGSHSGDDVVSIFEKQLGLCANCHIKLVKSGRQKYHVDHIMPLARGGSDWPSNLQCLCPSCNMSKNAKDPIMWANENGRLL